MILDVQILIGKTNIPETIKIPIVVIMQIDIVANTIIKDQATTHIQIMEFIVLPVINLYKEMKDLDIIRLIIKLIIFSKLWIF